MTSCSLLVHVSSTVLPRCSFPSSYLDFVRVRFPSHGTIGLEGRAERVILCNWNYLFAHCIQDFSSLLLCALCLKLQIWIGSGDSENISSAEGWRSHNPHLLGNMYVSQGGGNMLFAGCDCRHGWKSASSLWLEKVRLGEKVLKMPFLTSASTPRLRRVFDLRHSHIVSSSCRNMDIFSNN